MDYLDSGIRIAQTVLPPALRYLGRASEREAKLAHAEADLVQTKAELEVLVMKNHELSEAEAQVKVLQKMNQELTESNSDLEAFKNLVMVLVVVAAVVLVGMALTPKAA